MTGRILFACAAGLALTAVPALAIAQERSSGEQGKDGFAQEQGKASSQQGTGGSAQHQQGGKGAQQSQHMQRPQGVLDVEELNDNVASYVGKNVTIAGEIQEKLGSRSFVLESGGIFDDEIAVIVPNDARGIAVADLAEDADVLVTGTVRAATIAEIERETGWDLDPQLEVEFEGTRHYLVASAITRQQAAR